MSKATPPGLPCGPAPATRPCTLRRWEFLLASGILAWMFLACCFPLRDTDFWWHLKTGELILERGTVPQLDWFTYTDWDKPWIDLHWGFQLLVTALYRLGGINLIILAKAAILTLAVAIAAFAGRSSLPLWARAGLWILPIIAISGRGNERPEMLSLLFLAAWLCILSRLDEYPRLIWLLAPIQLIWTNCHALFVLGLVVGGCFVGDHLLRCLARGRLGLEHPAESPSLRQMIWTGGLVLLACLANPYFEEGALFPLVLYRKFSVDQAFYSTRIFEFQRPIDFVREKGWNHFYLLVEIGVWCVAAASFVWLARFKRLSAMRLLLFAGFSHLAWQATRNTSLFALVSGSVTCANCSDALRLRSALPHALSRRLRLTPLWMARFMSAVAAGLIASVVSGAWDRWGQEDKPLSLGEAEAWFAHGACRFAGQPGFPDRAFVAQIGQAAVYIYHNAPERKVFMDGRLEVCTQTTFELFEVICGLMSVADRRWETLLRTQDGKLPVVILDSRFSRREITGLLNTPGWRLVFADQAAAVFLEDHVADSLKLPVADYAPLASPPGTRPRRQGLPQ